MLDIVGIIAKVRHLLPVSHTCTLYRALVEPYLSYCNLIWVHVVLPDDVCLSDRCLNGGIKSNQIQIILLHKLYISTEQLIKFKGVKVQRSQEKQAYVYQAPIKRFSGFN